MLMLRRTSLALALLLATTHLLAQSRGRPVTPPAAPLPGTSVTGFVTAVNGTQIALANGAVVVDASHATITGDDGHPATITVGALIFAMLQTDNSLQASKIVVTHIPQVTLTGPLQSINVAANTFRILGVTVSVDANTSFGGSHGVHSLADLHSGDLVVVQADGHGAALAASSILAFAPMVQPPAVIEGTVKSIEADHWVIFNDRTNSDVTVLVNAQTHILGSPKVGDSVYVLANIDSAHNYVAISIAVEPSNPPRAQMHIHGVVKSIGATSWVVGPAVGLGPDFIVQVNAQTRIIGDPHVGDHVDVLVEILTNGVTAVTITKE